MLWEGLAHWTIATETLLVLDQLLVVLMLVEILHTVRISIRSHFLVTEPFLVVGLIASIRRVLVITLEAATLTKGGTWSTESASIFRASMTELGVVGTAHPHFGIFHYAFASVRSRPEKHGELRTRLVNLLRWKVERSESLRIDSCILRITLKGGGGNPSFHPAKCKVSHPIRC